MLRKKQPTYLITFHTTADAMAMERQCKEYGLAGRLLPVPRSITSDCGIAWAVQLDQKEALDQLIYEKDMAFAGKYEAEM